MTNSPPGSPAGSEEYPAFYFDRPQGPWDFTPGGAAAPEDTFPGARTGPPGYEQAAAEPAPSWQAVASYERAVVEERGTRAGAPPDYDSQDRFERDLLTAELLSLDVRRPAHDGAEAQFRRDLAEALRLSLNDVSRPVPPPSARTATAPVPDRPEVRGARSGPLGGDSYGPGATSGPLDADPYGPGATSGPLSADPYAFQEAARASEASARARFGDPADTPAFRETAREAVRRGQQISSGQDPSNPIGGAAHEFQPPARPSQERTDPSSSAWGQRAALLQNSRRTR